MHSPIHASVFSQKTGGTPREPGLNAALLSVQARFRSVCRGFLIREIEPPPLSMENLFTGWEAARAAKMGPRRLRSFAAARTSLKELARELGLVDARTRDRAIETLDPDGIRPTLPSNAVHWAVSHDDRFVVAAADTRPLGVDVERISDRPLKGIHIFMSPRERERSVCEELDLTQSATRAWSVKEALAKARNLNLPRAWREVRILSIGAERSVVRTGGKKMAVIHGELEGHVISLAVWDRDGKSQEQSSLNPDPGAH
jgi:phosphopantetheinyl transferase (holo-ACP synthase)